MTTALEQQREDQALGAAWRRCEVALPEGWWFRSLISVPSSVARSARRSSGIAPVWEAVAHEIGRRGISIATGPTPTAALLQLAEKLESMNG